MDEKQIIEVEYDEKLVEDYKNNYIMEEEGIGSEIGEIYGQQDTFNDDNIEELLNLDEVSVTFVMENQNGGDQ